MIAVTVIGGYLGAGKTTLVNHILTEATERIAVLVNDFGDVAIDASLIASASDTAIELSNGCICCSLVDGLHVALEQIIDLDPPVQRLVIEASGVSDPAVIAAYSYRPGLTREATVVLVDAETIRSNAADRLIGQAVSTQLDAADVIVANKTDLVASAPRAETLAWLRSKWPEAVVIETMNSVVAPEVLFGVTRRPTVELAPPDPSTGDATDMFHTWTWCPDDAPNRGDIGQFMDSLPGTAIRAKGFVELSDDPGQAYLLQRVGRRWTPGIVLRSGSFRRQRPCGLASSRRWAGKARGAGWSRQSESGGRAAQRPRSDWW